MSSDLSDGLDIDTFRYGREQFYNIDDKRYKVLHYIKEFVHLR